MTDRYKTYPPWRRGNISVPVAPRSATLAGLSLYAACRHSTLLAHRTAWIATTLLGGRALPGPAVDWSPPMGVDGWSALRDAWRSALGPFNGQAIYQRMQSERSGLAVLLLRRGQPLAFVKLCEAGDRSIETELQALRAVHRNQPVTFFVPEPLTAHVDVGWHWLALAPLPARYHVPAKAAPIPAIIEDLQSTLSTLPARTDTPAHWRPMHGDFTPWNLRRVGRQFVLVDWEDAGWGPPGADEVYYQAAWAALRGKVGQQTPNAEALRYWLGRMAASNSRGDELGPALTRALAAMESSRASVAG